MSHHTDSTLRANHHMGSLWVIGALAFLVSGCREDLPAAHFAIIPIQEIGIEYEVGSRESVPVDAVLRRIVDAALIGDTLAVLDASPPFVKMFDSGGEFAGNRVGKGDGPGEGTRPIAIGRAGPRSFIITEHKSLTLISLDAVDNGGVIENTDFDDRVFRGGAIGCGNYSFSLITTNGFEQPGALIAARTLDGTADTLSRLGPIRANSVLAQPLFIDATDEAVAFYTEEAGVPRLQVVHCDNWSIVDLAIDSLGRQQWYEPTATGFSLHPSEPPRPAGLAVTPAGVLWATQVLAGAAGADSLTLISLLEADADVQRMIAVPGWFQLLDSDARGRLVIGIQEPVPRVIVVRREGLIDLIQERGSAVSRDTARLKE
jgi:hypothetical protein